jgi:hypothetical protein
MPSFHVYPGTPGHLIKSQAASSPSRSSQQQQQQQQQQPQQQMPSTSHTTHLTNSLGSYYLLEEFRLELLNRNALTLALPNTHAYPGILLISESNVNLKNYFLLGLLFLLFDYFYTKF